MSLSRRTFLATTSSLAAAAVWSSRADRRMRQNVKLPDYPFQLGVASGDPSPDGFVVWTRLAPKPLEGGGMPAEAVEVAWQVAEDEAMSRVVAKGTTVANPDWGHSVHVEVQGLSPVAGIGISLRPPAKPARSAAREPCRRPMRCPSAEVRVRLVPALGEWPVHCL